MARTKQALRKINGGPGNGNKRKRKANQLPKAVLCSVCGKGDGRYKCPKCRAPFCCVQCSKDHKANSCPGSATKTAKEDASGGATASAANREQSNYLSSKELKSTRPRTKRVRRNESGNYDSDDSHDDEPGWNITPEMKKRIQQSSWLHKELQDGGLRQLIEQIDAASDDENESGGGAHKNKRYQKNKNPNETTISPRELALARTKHSHPKFASFVDQMLLSAGVLQPASEGGVVADDTISSILEGHGPLVMAPVPRRSVAIHTSNAELGSDSESSDDGTDSDSDSDSDSDEDSDGSGSSSDRQESNKSSDGV